VVLLGLGSVVGLLLSGAAVSGIRAKLGPLVPMLPVTGHTWLAGIALAILIGLLVGLLPALRGMQLRIVDALSGR
jgi:putative ABC transport system permease protein